MFTSLVSAAIGGVAAKQACVDGWCSMAKKVVPLKVTFPPVSFGDCLNFCIVSGIMSEGVDCQGFSLEVGDSQEGTCTLYKFDDELGVSLDVFAYFPNVDDVSKVWPEAVYTYQQVGGSMTVSGVDQCRGELGSSSLDPKFAFFGNQECGTKPTVTTSIVDGQQVSMGSFIRLKYTKPAVEGLAAEKPGKSYYLTLSDKGFTVQTNINIAGTKWTWSNGGVDQISDQNPVCLSAQAHLTPIYVDSSVTSLCAMGMKGGSPNGSPFGWMMKDRTDGAVKCMGDVIFGADQGLYDLIQIEDPVNNTCNKQWEVQGGYINQVLLSRACDAGAFDGAWVDGQPYSPGDFSWYDKMTISSGDNQLTAHTKQGDANVPYSISIDGCSITLYLQKGCDDCIATGTLSEGGDRIDWDTGFNDGDFWTRKNQGCCTLFDAILRSPSTHASPTPESRSSPNDAACVEQFSGRWVDTSKGDFFSWVPYMDLSGGRPVDEVEDDSNGRMTAPTEQGSWVLPVKFYSDGGVCRLKQCLAKECPGLAYATGTLDVDEIHWDMGLNNGTWERVRVSSACDQAADLPYSCCNPEGKFGCSFAPNKAVCDNAKGDFCCNPDEPKKACGLEPTSTPITLTLV